MTPKPLVALCLADAFLAGAVTRDAMYARALAAVGLASAPWLKRLTERICNIYGVSLAHTRREKLARHIFADLGLRAGWVEAAKSITIRKYFLGSPEMLPRRNLFRRSRLPVLPTTGDLAALLDVPINRIEWFAGSLGQHSQKRRPATGGLNHYNYRWLVKRSGHYRLLEIPKSELRLLQRRILVQLLEHVPTHDAAHGFCRGRSSVTHALPHLKQAVVMRIDLKDFFPSIPAPRIHAMFNTLGYPDPVARALTGLCTHLQPSAALRNLRPPNGVPITWAERKRLQIPHLPQGAPTSPALANLCAYRLDCRLAKLAESCGARYTRYADDLVFSGDATFARRVERVQATVCRIALEEGFEVNTRKTRIMRRGARQEVTGVVVNERPNISRDTFDALKATLHNCIEHGAQAQKLRAGLAPEVNFAAYLRGKIAYVHMLNPHRALKLRVMFDKVMWR